MCRTCTRINTPRKRPPGSQSLSTNKRRLHRLFAIDSVALVLFSGDRGGHLENVEEIKHGFVVSVSEMLFDMSKLGGGHVR